jgi:two-component system chemotaxis sensor kinase CheA
MAKQPKPSSREVVDAALNRLLCDLALGEGGVVDTANRSSELVTLVVGLGSPALDALIGDVAVANGPRDLEQALTAFSEAWNVWTADSDQVSVPATAPMPATSGESVAPAPGSTSAVEGSSSRSRVDEDVAALHGDPELAAMFIGEALDHLSSIEACVLQLEAAPGDTKLLNDIFRPFHTVKGNAGALGVTRVQELAHKVENLLDLCRSGRHTLGPAETDAVLEAVDVLTALINDIQSRLHGQSGTDLEPRRCALMDVVDGLVNGTGTVSRTVDTPIQASVQASVQTAFQASGLTAVDTPAGTSPHQVAETPAEARPRESASPSDPASKPNFARRADDVAGQASVKVDTRKLDNLVDMVGELVIAQAILQEDPALLKAADERLTRNLAQLKRITSDLQKNAMSMRMVPIRQTFQKMARLVRDLSKKSGKSVDLVLSGEDTELDRRVVEDINDPLMHMVRNSVDHGIEDAERRLTAGKRAEGRLALSAYHQGGNIVIAITDDGAGLNSERILAKAVSQGLVRPTETLTPSEIHQLIFRPGFSTAEKITEISGRGVGMDVVRRNIDALRGRIEIQSTIGQGTTFLIKLPLTLAILDGLVLGVGTERFVMPTFGVRESLRPVPEQVHRVQGRPCMMQVRDKLVPLVWLAELFGIQGRETDTCRATVVVIEDDGHQVGLVVDRLLGKQEVVIKSLGEAFGQMSGVAGGAILGDGRVGLILDAHGIVGRTRGDGSRAA